MEYKDIVSCLANFEFLQGRLKFIKLDDITFIDDTYNSNPLSLVEALNALENFVTRGRKIFVMGDMLELGSRKDMFHYQAGQKAARVCDAFITVGRLSKLAAQSAQASGFDQRNIFSCESCSDARDVLFNKVSPRKDDIVLVKGSRLMNMEEIFKI
jgi:UDP-N-acetylmuramoyl-tripeptide--D-alanyl-D-alanine ligase